MKIQYENKDAGTSIDDTLIIINNSSADTRDILILIGVPINSDTFDGTAAIVTTNINIIGLDIIILNINLIYGITSTAVIIFSIIIINIDTVAITITIIIINIVT